MLKMGYLQNQLLRFLGHTPEVIDPYLDALDQVFALVAECESGVSWRSFGGPVYMAFERQINLES